MTINKIKEKIQEAAESDTKAYFSTSIDGYHCRQLEEFAKSHGFVWREPISFQLDSGLSGSTYEKGNLRLNISTGSFFGVFTEVEMF